MTLKFVQNINKIEFKNFFNIRFFFIATFFLECILLSYFNTSERFSDLVWYTNSGEKLISGSAEFENYFYSPLFSLLAVTIKKSADNNFIFLLLQVLKTIYFFGTSIIFSYLINFSNKKKRFFNHQLLVIIFILLNPFIVKYINPEYSDSFSLVAGIFFVLRYSQIKLVKPYKIKIWIINNLVIRDSYYLLLLFLCLLRYSVFLLLVTSILIDLYKFIASKANIHIIKFLKISFLSLSIIGILYFANSYVPLYLKYSTTFVLMPHIKTNVIYVFFAFLCATLGFRESFSSDLSNPFNLFNLKKMSEIIIISNEGLELSKFEIGFSILLGVIFLFISLLSITRLFYYRHPLLMPFCISFLLLINTELFISFAHYRYMLLLIPIIIRGLSFERKEKISLSNKNIYNKPINEILI